MRIEDLYKYGQDEFNYFRCLTNAEKIEFVDSVCNAGVENTLKHFIALEHEVGNIPVMSQTIDFRGLGVIYVVFYEDEMHIYSQSLKAIKLYVRKLFEDGNILYKVKTRKPKEIEERFYFVYNILPNTLPLCLS